MPNAGQRPLAARYPTSAPFLAPPHPAPAPCPGRPCPRPRQAAPAPPPRVRARTPTTGASGRPAGRGVEGRVAGWKGGGVEGRVRSTGGCRRQGRCRQGSGKAHARQRYCQLHLTSLAWAHGGHMAGRCARASSGPRHHHANPTHLVPDVLLRPRGQQHPHHGHVVVHARPPQRRAAVLRTNGARPSRPRREDSERTGGLAVARSTHWLRMDSTAATQ